MILTKVKLGLGVGFRAFWCFLSVLKVILGIGDTKDEGSLEEKCSLESGQEKWRKLSEIIMIDKHQFVKEFKNIKLKHNILVLVYS